MAPNVAVRVRTSISSTSPDGSSTWSEALQRIRAELELPSQFPAAVEAGARTAVAAARLPELDATDLPFVTIDPEGSMDLDQALHLERRSDGGFEVHYAIADVAAFVDPGGAIDAEARRRGETLYGAGERIPLHLTVLSEDGASLLPDQVRPALWWTIRLDERGATTHVQVRRALVRSVRRWSYVEAQAALDAPSDTAPDRVPEVLVLLREIGTLREGIEAERGGISLPLPEQEIEESAEGVFTLSLRESLPVEEWNAQISLLTGMAAADLMLEAGVGLLRTLPPADPRDVARLRRVAHGLGIDWPADAGYPALVRSLDPREPAHQAMAVACTRLLRGSGYAAFDGTAPEQPLHAAIGAPYAHVTAPLRRLGDRFAGEICLAVCAGEPVPEWVRAALPELPDLLRDSGRRAGAFERAVVDLVEAAVLRDRVGEEFSAVITEVDAERPGRGVALVREIGVEATVHSEQDLPLGEEVRVRLEVADLDQRRVVFVR